MVRSGLTASELISPLAALKMLTARNQGALPGCYLSRFQPEAKAELALTIGLLPDWLPALLRSTTS
jgi:hypothetical protein